MDSHEHGDHNFWSIPDFSVFSIIWIANLLQSELHTWTSNLLHFDFICASLLSPTNLVINIDMGT